MSTLIRSNSHAHVRRLKNELIQGHFRQRFPTALPLFSLLKTFETFWHFSQMHVSAHVQNLPAERGRSDFERAGSWRLLIRMQPLQATNPSGVVR